MWNHFDSCHVGNLDLHNLDPGRHKTTLIFWQCNWTMRRRWSTLPSTSPLPLWTHDILTASHHFCIDHCLFIHDHSCLFGSLVINLCKFSLYQNTAFHHVSSYHFMSFCTSQSQMPTGRAEVWYWSQWETRRARGAWGTWPILACRIRTIWSTNVV